MASRTVAIWNRREVLALMVRRDLKIKYESSALGYFWTLLEPLAMTAVYYLIFDRVLGRSGREHYVLFLMSGMLPWMWFNAVLGDSTRALSRQSRLITTLNLPRELFPVQLVGAKTVEWLATLPVLVAVAAVSRVGPHWQGLLALYAVLLQLALCIGVALLLSSLTVLLADVARLVRVSTRALFFLTPIFYDAARFRENAPGFYEIWVLNPMVAIVELHRSLWFPQDVPDARAVISGTVVTGLLLLAGVATFRRLEPAVLKEI